MTPDEEGDTLKRAYVPEHVVGLMTLISKGDPFVIDDHLGLVRGNWLILVGYPLDRRFSLERCGRLLDRVVEVYSPDRLSFIGPEIPPGLLKSCGERETDRYYTLDLAQARPRPSVLKAVRQASRNLTVDRGRAMTAEHRSLISEFLDRAPLPARIRELYMAMPDYVGRSQTAWTLDARDRSGNLCAFYVVDLGAADFSIYVLGAHSRKRPVPHASDLLFLEMMDLTREQGKGVINLGLGVNEGIRRFKEKWGGRPFLRYEFCECRYGKAKVSLIGALLARYRAC